MSASLVGSEMCIRDRHRRAPESAEKKAAEAASGSLPEAVSAALRRSPAPVSYTHLTLPTICSV
eukprot:1863839-Alexandrium_andersonii.AAC.1